MVRKQQTERAPEQFRLDFGVPERLKRKWAPRPPLDYLFFAVLPPPAVAARIAERAENWRRRRGLHARPRRPELLHISLNGVGLYVDLPDNVVQAAVDAGSRVEMAPFEVTFDRALSFKSTGPRPFVLCSSGNHAGLAELRRAIGSSMQGIGFRGSDHGFTPHVTLLYTDELLPETSIDEPVSWTVRDFVLVHSLHGRSRHVHRRRWPLLC